MIRGRYLQPLPRGRPVNREEFLLARARGRSIIHVGFTDQPLLDERVTAGTWLHSRLAKVAASLVGLDVDADGVAWASERGYRVRCVDASDERAVTALELEPADLVIAGEVIEHVDAPGPFLRAMHLLGDELIVTTPNGLRALGFLAPLAGVEVIHTDHVHVQTPTTLRALFETTGWHVTGQWYYQMPTETLRGVGARRMLLGAANNTVSMLAGASRRPYWCDGLIAAGSAQADAR